MKAGGCWSGQARLDSVPASQPGPRGRARQRPRLGLGSVAGTRGGVRAGWGCGETRRRRAPSSPLDGARRLGRARPAQQQQESGQEHGGEEQDQDEPGAEVCALAQRRRLGGDQVGQVQHVAERPADRGVPGLRARGTASASAQPGSPAPPRPGAPAPTFFWKVTPPKARSWKP